MSSETCLLDQHPVRECLADGRAARQEFATTWNESLDELADLRANLDTWQRELSEEQVQIERVRSIFEDEKRACYEEIAANKDENAALRGQLDSANAAREELQNELESARTSVEAVEESRTENGELRDQVRMQQTEMESNQRQIDELRSGLEAVEEFRTENEELRAQVRMQQTEMESTQQRTDELRSELEIARQGASAAVDQNDQLQNAIQELTDVQQEVKINQQQFDETRTHCEALEAELETVRNRAVELSETLARERHQMASDRAEWADELKRIRQQAVDQAAAARNVAPPPAESNSGGSRSNDSVATEAPSDIVVGSVLAQFDKIRQQRARRRVNE